MMDASQPIKPFPFPRMRVVKALFIFTALSIMFGILATLSPTVCSAGWVVGTINSTLGGVFYGRGAKGDSPPSEEARSWVASASPWVRCSRGS
jgi:hypothetical protein